MYVIECKIISRLCTVPNLPFFDSYRAIKKVPALIIVSSVILDLMYREPKKAKPPGMGGGADCGCRGANGAKIVYSSNNCF